jgi:hypothetical protein
MLTNVLANIITTSEERYAPLDVFQVCSFRIYLPVVLCTEFKVDTKQLLCVFQFI